MPKPLITSMLLWTVVALQPAQAAPDARAAYDVQLHAGPSPDFPLVATLQAGTEFSVHGCLDDLSWCDVATALDRGWVDADSITRSQGDSNVSIRLSGTGVGIVDFDLLPYWEQHYADQPWYGDRERWARGPPVNRQHWPQFPGRPPLQPQPPSPPAPPKPAQPVMPSPAR